MTLAISAAALLVTTLPFAVVAWHAASRPHGRADWLVRVVLAGAVTLVGYVAIPWGRTSYYLRYALVAALVIASVRAFARTGPRTGAVRPMRLRIALLVPALWLSVVAATALRLPSDGIALHFPLAAGTYYVIQGGGSALVNPFHRMGSGPARAPGPEALALDIVQLNRLGSRAAGIQPRRLASYVIHGVTVYSPCDGVVAAAVDGRPDTPVGAAGVHPGNQVVIRCHGARVTLAHLARGLAVRLGDSVRRGQPIGRVGSSGRSTEPHLHVDAVRDGVDGTVVPLPMRFDGRVLTLNSVVRR